MPRITVFAPRSFTITMKGRGWQPSSFFMNMCVIDEKEDIVRFLVIDYHNLLVLGALVYFALALPLLLMLLQSFSF